jgi:hypothetical protein
METVLNKVEINCGEVVDRLGRLESLFAEYESTLNNPDIRDNLPAGIKLSEEIETILLELEEILPNENILEIDRSINLVEFLKKPTSEGGLGIDCLDSEKPIDESDERNDGLIEIDLSKVRLDTEWFRDELKNEDGYVLGEKRLEDLKKRDTIRLDLFVFASLWKLLQGNEEQKKEFENKLTIIAKANGVKFDDLKKMYYIVFDDTIISRISPFIPREPGSRNTLYLRWRRESGWRWGIYTVDVDWDGNMSSLVLKS